MTSIEQYFSLLVLGIWLILSSPTQAADECQPPDCIVYGLTLNVSGIDPHINRNTELGIVLRNVYDTLLYREPQSREFVPGLAEAWTISPDGLVYEFHLRQDVHFHDGTAFNAEAVEANFERIFAEETASQRSKFLLGPIASYQVVDAFTFRITLLQPFEPLLDSLSQVYLGIASPTALTASAGDPLRYQYHQLGTGPFRFIEYLPEDRIVIERNPDYAWGPRFYGEAGSLNRIEFRFYRDAATRLIALENGDAMIMGEIPPNDARLIADNPNLTLLPVAIAGQPLQFYMNTQQAPTDDIRVRQALSYAINRTAIVNAVYGGFSPVAWGPLSAETLYYNPSIANSYAYNLDEARHLLVDAGYGDSNGDAILDRNGAVLAIKLLQPPWGNIPEVVQFLQDQWRSLGIQVDVVQVPSYPALLEAATARDYNLISFDQAGLDPYILNQAYLSSSQDNWTGFNDSELDALLLQAASESDPEARRLAYGHAQDIIMEQALILPIRDYVNLNGVSTQVQGLSFDPYGWFPLLYGVSISE